jgi:hypothetical protein
MARVLKLGGGVARLPEGITHSSFKVQGAIADEPISQTVPCDPNIHPLIVDFDSGNVESVNPQALSALSIHDVPR